MDHKADTALYPGIARSENQIDEAGDRRSCHAALSPIHALLLASQRRIFVYRQRGIRPAVFFPVAVVRMVIIVMLRPDVLRHARDDAEQKTGRAIKPVAAK